MNGRYEFAILDVCANIHGSVAGTGDTLPDERLTELREWLRMRVRTWEPEYSGVYERHSAAVLELMRATLELSGGE